MGERMLRGSRLGAVSYESDRNTELAPRQTREYLCAKGHRFESASARAGQGCRGGGFAAVTGRLASRQRRITKGSAMRQYRRGRSV